MSQIKKEEEASFVQEDTQQPIPPESVVAYNELRSCADLLRMHTSGKLEIQPDFQRDVVWKPDEQARFIDSLVKQLPIPSMCFSLDHQTQKWKVIDGLQRMSTITSFLGKLPWKMSTVEDIHPLLRGKTNIQLRDGSEEEKRLYSSVEDISIPITVIRCSYADKSHMRYLFTIFNRLNSGGVRLNNQEIRNCIYSGAFNDTLKTLDKSNPDWLKVKRRIWGKMDRFRSVEVLLRTIAFARTVSTYDGNLAGFLNDEMLRGSRLQQAEITKIETELKEMAKLAAVVLEKSGRGKRSLTFVEGLLVGILANITKLNTFTEAEIGKWAEDKASSFAQLPTFRDSARYALSSVANVTTRLQQSISLFAN